jgi:hypothetical protein
VVTPTKDEHTVGREHFTEGIELTVVNDVAVAGEDGTYCGIVGIVISTSHLRIVEVCIGPVNRN